MTRKISLGLLLLFLSSLPAAAQNFTNVSGTITDSSAIPYANCNVTAELVPSGTNPTIGGAAIGGLNRASCDVNGNFSMTLGSNAVIVPGGTQWKFTVTSNGAPPPLGTGPQTCTTTLTISGVSQSISSNFSCPALGRASGSASSVGPVINVTNPIYAGGAQSSNADNSAQFTAALAAANALNTVTNPVVPQSTPQTAGVPSVTSTITQNALLLAGNTTYLFVLDSLNQNPSVLSDSGGSTYTQINTSFNTTGGWLRIYRTAIGGTVQSSTVTVTENPAEDVSISVISLPGVLSDSVGTGVTGSSTAPRVSLTTTSSNSAVLSACGWWNNASITLGTPLGTLQTNFGASAAVLGLAVFQAIQGPIGTVTNGGTLSATSPWGCQAIEVKGGGNVNALPTVYGPPGFFNFSNTISMAKPMKLQLEQGTYMCYIGSGHAVDVGSPGLTIATQQFPFIIDGGTWTCGANMTQGIFLNNFTTQGGIRNSSFINFGNSSSWAIVGNKENWDWEIGPQNRFLINDYQPRNFIRNNLLGASGTFDSFFRIHDNNMFCLPAYLNVGCAAAQAGIGILLDGYTNRVYHNNMAFMNPLVRIVCTATSTCINNQIDQNQMESVATGAGLPVIQFSNQEGMLVTQNTILMHSTGASSIGPVSGTDTLSGSRVNFNTVSQNALVTPLVQLNNVAGQAGNQSFGNECSAALTIYLPCALLHTLGGNIGQWNPDNWIALTYSAATAASYTFSQTYGQAPKCAQPAGISPGTTTFTITTLNTTTLTVTASASFTGTVNVSCSAGDAQ